MRFVPVLFVLLACGGGDDGGDDSASGVTCQTCADNGEVCVTNADGEPEDWVDRCAPMPTECDVADPCDDNACASALYDLCDDLWIGEGRSCSGGIVSVTCSPDGSI